MQQETTSIKARGKSEQSQKRLIAPPLRVRANSIEVHFQKGNLGNADWMLVLCLYFGPYSRTRLMVFLFLPVCILLPIYPTLDQIDLGEFEDM